MYIYIFPIIDLSLSSGYHPLQFPIIQVNSLTRIEPNSFKFCFAYLDYGTDAFIKLDAYQIN